MILSLFTVNFGFVWYYVVFCFAFVVGFIYCRVFVVFGISVLCLLFGLVCYGIFS